MSPVGGAVKLEREPLQALVRDALGKPVVVARVERVEPWFVLRCHLAPDPSDVPASVIVKWLREDANGFRTDPRQLLTERAALAFLDELSLPVAPRLLGCNADTTILVMEDLAPRAPLSDLLQEPDQDRDAAGLHLYARTLGLLAASTAGRHDAYYERRRALGSVDPAVDRDLYGGAWGDSAAKWLDTATHAEALGVTPSSGVEAEVTAIFATLAEPGALLAFSNGDAGANNFLVDGDDGRLIDFEFAGYRHALIDAVLLYVPGPMWLTVGDPVADGLEDAYRRALTEGIPEAADQEMFGHGIAAACLAFAVERLSRFPRLDARARGDDSRAQMVSTLESAAGAAEHHRSFPVLAGWARAVAAALRERWPDADRDFRTLPPYTRRR